jgi:hypothetical protein
MCIFPPVSLCVHVLGLGEVLTREVDEGREDNGVDVLGKESSTEHVVLERGQVVDLRTAQETKNNKGERAPSLASLSSILLEYISISPDMLRMPRAPVLGRVSSMCSAVLCLCALAALCQPTTAKSPRICLRILRFLQESIPSTVSQTLGHVAL